MFAKSQRHRPEAEGAGRAKIPAARIPGLRVSVYGFPIRLFLIALLLGVAYVVVHRLNPYGMAPGSSEASRLLFQIFDLDSENNVPTWYAALLWAIAAGLALVSARREFSPLAVVRWSWTLLGGVFLLLSIDEAASLHERWLDLAGDAVQDMTGVADSFYYNWVALAAVLAASVAALLVPFLLRIRRDVAVCLILGGALFLMGSLGFETVSSAIHRGWISSIHQTGLTWPRLIILEELFETFGAIVAIHAMLRWLTSPQQAGTPSELQAGVAISSHGDVSALLGQKSR